MATFVSELVNRLPRLEQGRSTNRAEDRRRLRQREGPEPKRSSCQIELQYRLVEADPRVPGSSQG